MYYMQYNRVLNESKTNENDNVSSYWDCPQCTFRNNKTNINDRICEICGYEKLTNNKNVKCFHIFVFEQCTTQPRNIN